MSDTVAEGHYRQLDAEEVAKLARAVDRALTENKPVPRFQAEARLATRREKVRKTDGEKGQQGAAIAARGR